MKKLALCAMAAAAVVAACSPKSALTKSGLDPQKFVTTVGETQTALYSITNKAGMEVCFTNIGARIVSIMVPDRDGVMRDVVLGFDNVQDYMTHQTDFGAAIGRYANRIANATFTLDDVKYELPANNNGHCLHGGPNGWQYACYTAAEVEESRIKFTLVSPSGDAGFPGTVNVSVTYSLSDDNALGIYYDAETDAPTVINMTNHSYFNLNGDPTKTILNHELTINASSCTPADALLIPTGEITSVEGTPFDFRTAKTIGQDIETEGDAQLIFGRGYDHNWVLDTACDASKKAAELYCPETGIKFSVFTSEPGIQVYTGNFLDGTEIGKGGIAYNHRTAVCMETQHYPDSPNKPEFPSTVLRPGEKYRSNTTYYFSIVE